MSNYLRKCVNLGPSGTYPPIDNRQRVATNGEHYATRPAGSSVGTNTGWTKIWAVWPVLQPDPNVLGSGSGFDTLDSEILYANLFGLKVIVGIYKCPSWASGYDASNTPPGYDWGFHFPADPISPTGPYGRFVEHLLGRYSRNSTAPWKHSTARIDALEIMNEPNGQMWPQRDSNNQVSSHCPTASMIRCAQTVYQGLNLGTDPLLLAPGTSDTDEATVDRTRYDDFTQRVLGELHSANFNAGPMFAWSHHNYNDCRYDSGAQTTTGQTTNRAGKVRRILKTPPSPTRPWAGWTNGNSGPGPIVFLTEGGVLLTQMGGNQQLQSDRIQRAWNRMRSESGTWGVDGAGIAMFSNYLFYSDPSMPNPYDSGLGNASGPPLTPRIAYHMWNTLPKFI